jgi:nucleotide-binding universal stress UspA family protein
MTHIQAYVTPLRARVSLTPDTRPEDLGRMAEYADFLDETELDVTRPQADLSTSELGEYSQLIEHISVHRYYIGQEHHREIPFREAAANWFDTVYLPVIQVVRERGLLQDFPGRTETDVYLWLAQHRAQLEEQLGKRIEAVQAAQHLAQAKGARRGSTGLGGSVIDALLPNVLEPGPLPGEWRREKESQRRGEQEAPNKLFKDVLVAIDGQESGWLALDQALVIAHREASHLDGLHVVASADLKTSPEALSIQGTFEQRFTPAGLSGRLTLADGEVARAICAYAAWSDLVVIRLAHPPESAPLARLSSSLVTLVQRCPRPILAVTQNVSPLSHALLAYDGSPKAREALYVATYLAGQWDIDLTVITVLQDQSVTTDAAEEAETYLRDHGVKAHYQIEHSRDLADLAPHIILSAADCQANFIIMGGYGITPIQNVLRDTVVDQVLRRSRMPVLLCR